MATRKMGPKMASALPAAGQQMQMPSSPMPAMKKGGGVKKMAKGGFTSAADGIAQSGKTRGRQVTMKSGGKC